jgi:Na+/proline symporter
MEIYNIPMGIGVFVALAVFLAVGFAMVPLIRRSGKRYIIAGKQLPFILAGSTLLAQSMDANASLGNAGNVYASGFWAGFQFPLGLAICLALVGAFFAKPLNRMNLITLPDYFYRRFNRPTEVLVAMLMTFSFIILVAGNLAGAAWILSTLMPIPFVWGLVIMAAVVFLYTLAGGLFAVVSTDITQIYPAILAFFAGAIWLLIAYGGWQAFSGSIPAGYFDWSGLTKIESGGLLNWAGILALGIGDIIALDFMERVFAAKDPETAQKSCYWGAAWTLAAGFACSMIGLMAFKLIPEISDYRMVLPTIAMHYVPFAAGLFMMVGVIGAGLSTADGGMLATASVWGRNIIQRNILKLWQRHYTHEERAELDRRLLWITRMMGIPVMALAILLAYVKPEPGIMLVLAFDVVFAGCLVPLVLGLFWKKANAYGALAGCVAGSVLRGILFFAIPPDLAGLDTLIPPVVSLIVMVPVSLLTQKQDPPKHEVNLETPDDDEVLSTRA